MAEKTKFNEMNKTDLENRLKVTSDELLTAKQKHRLGQLKKTSDLLRLKKEIARIKTYIRMKQETKAA